MSKSVEIVELIRTDLARRGDGKETPIRAIVQYWDKEGNLVFESDPGESRVTPERMQDIRKLLNSSVDRRIVGDPVEAICSLIERNR